MNKPTIYVAIADAHNLIREALVAQMNTTDDLKVIIDAADGSELLDKIERGSFQPDVCIIDIVMPGMNGFETTRQVKEKYPRIHVLAVTAIDSEQSILQMLNSGACGYLLKNDNAHIFPKAIREVYTTGYYFSDKVLHKLPKLKSGNTEAYAKNLFSEQEIVFLSLCCTEMTYGEIAKKMYLSVKTIEHKAEKLSEQIGVHTRVGLAMYAHYSGIGSFNDRDI